MKTAYVANPATLSFAADAGAAGKYTLEAASNGATKTQAIDAAATVPPVTFTFLDVVREPLMNARFARASEELGPSVAAARHLWAAVWFNRRFAGTWPDPRPELDDSRARTRAG